MAKMTYAEMCEAMDDETIKLDSFLEWEDRHLSAFERFNQARRYLELAPQIRYEAESLYNSGLVADAERRLECFLYPKWHSLKDCEDDYREAMNR